MLRPVQRTANADVRVITLRVFLGTGSAVDLASYSTPIRIPDQSWYPVRPKIEEAINRDSTHSYPANKFIRHSPFGLCLNVFQCSKAFYL